MKNTFILLLLIVLDCSLAIGQQPNDTLSIMFVGDIMNHGPQLRAAYRKETKQYDFSENFKYVASIFKKSDIVVANLETTIGVKPYSGYPQFSAPAALVRDCKKAGITHFGTANNHSCDKRKRGIVNTIKVLDTMQVAHFGTYSNVAERIANTPLMLQKKGISLALLNYTYGTNGLPIPKPAVVNLIDTIQIKKDIVKAQNLRADVIIVFLHWGNQYQHKPNNKQKKMAKWLHQNGVAMVIGSHPHVIQPNFINLPQPNILQQELTVYSLGNFISNQRTYPRDGSMIVGVKMIKDAEGNTRITEFTTQPIWVYKYFKAKKWHFEIIPIEQLKFNPVYFEQNKQYQKMLRYYKHYKSIIKQN